MRLTITFISLCTLLLYSKILNEWPESYDRKLNQNKSLFWSCVFAMVLVALLTIRRVKKTGILNREQTDEWKGWMQIIFLLYHYYRGTWIYNEIRVFVSVYVWMTGFGNFIYFTKKKDFSLKRVVSTLLRINLLTLGLMLFNGTSIMLYYVVPLHTGFFLMSWVVCWSIEKTKRPISMLLAALGALVLFFEVWQPLTGEMEFRFGLDRYSAWLGMASAYLFLNVNKCPADGFQTVAVPVGMALIALWYYVWGYEPDKYIYNPSHPYVVILPIVGYIFVRNGHPILRGYYSSAMAWFGGITLETYVLQFHILMCHNVQHILVICPWPVLNSCIVATVFVVVSWIARNLTIEIQKKVSNRNSKTLFTKEQYDNECNVLTRITPVLFIILVLVKFLLQKNNNSEITGTAPMLRSNNKLGAKDKYHVTDFSYGRLNLNTDRLYTNETLTISSNACQLYRISFQSTRAFQTQYSLGCSSCSNCVIRTKITQPGNYTVSAISILQEDSLHLTGQTFIKNTLTRKKSLPVSHSQIQVLPSSHPQVKCDLTNWIDGDWVDGQWTPACVFPENNLKKGWIHMYGDSVQRGIHQRMCKQYGFKMFGGSEKDVNKRSYNNWCKNDTLLITHEWYFLKAWPFIYKDFSFWNQLTNTFFNKPNVALLSFGSHYAQLGLQQSHVAYANAMKKMKVQYILQGTTAVDEYRIPRKFDKENTSQGVIRNNDRIYFKNQVAKKMCGADLNCLSYIDLFNMSLKGVPNMYADAVHFNGHMGALKAVTKILIHTLNAHIPLHAENGYNGWMRKTKKM